MHVALLISSQFTFCTENEFILRGVTHTSDRVCTHTSTCPPGQEEIMAPTLRSDRRCRSCGLGVTFKGRSGQRSRCDPVSVCPEGTHYQIGAPTTRRDRVCKRLTPPCDPSRGLFEVQHACALMLMAPCTHLTDYSCVCVCCPSSVALRAGDETDCHQRSRVSVCAYSAREHRCRL